MSTMAFTESLACGLQKSIGNFCTGDDFSDFTVVVEGTHFRCHRVILSASSGFFMGLLRSQMKECQEGFVKLDRINKNTFEIVLNSIYKGIDGLNKDTVLDVWSATELLQIDYMIEECKKFVINNISVDNCLAYLNHATIYSAQSVIDHSMNFIIKHFKQVRNADTFLQLPFDYLYKMIESDCLETDSEDSVLETILAWVNYEPSSDPSSWLFTGILDSEYRNEELSFVSDAISRWSIRENEEKINDGDQETTHPVQSKGNNKHIKGTAAQEADDDGQETDDDGEEKRNYNEGSKNEHVGQQRGNNGTTEQEIQEKVTDDGRNKKIDQVISDNAEFESNSDQKNTEEIKSSSLLKIGNDNGRSDVSKCLENVVKTETQTDKPGKNQSSCSKAGTSSVYNKERDRKNYFKKLLSACRYLLVNSARLQKVMKKHVNLLLNTGTYNLTLEALVYTLSVDQHHDSWPDAAVYRLSSSNKHVMVYLSDDYLLMAYSLSTGDTHTFMTVPPDFREELHKANITVFGNILYLQYEDKVKVRILSMLTKQKNWLSVNRTKEYNSETLVAHGSCLYELYSNVNEDTNHLRRYFCAHGNTRDWSHCCTPEITGDCLIGFQEYIVVFGTEYDAVTASCYNTETGKLHECEISMDGTSEDMVSFRHRKDVYLLQTNGCLWKLFSTDTSPVDFELVSKLWDFDCSLKGCVLYRQKLFVFCDEIPQMDSSSPLTTLSEIFEKIQMIKINSRTKCLPMILPQHWLDKENQND